MKERDCSMPEFVKNPFLPQKQVKLVLIDSRANQSLKSLLKQKGIDWIEVPPCPVLYPAISCHPDIQCHPLGGRRIMVAPNVNESLIRQLIQHSFEIVMGNNSLDGNYPGNIAYNVARMGCTAFHHGSYTDPALKEEYERQCIKLVHVRQGYTKCSVAMLNERALITSDKGIKKAAEGLGMDVLAISPGGISLKGLPYGFIGGACGLIAPDEMLFSGRLRYHSEYDVIVAFLGKYGIKPAEVEDAPLEDIGSIIPLMEACNSG